jgi:hypothetical protein
VAIRATNLALRNFELDALDRRRIANELTDVGDLRATHVIEFHHDRIEQSTIDTRMAFQVSEHEFSIPCLSGHSALIEIRPQLLAMAIIVRSPVSAPAIATDCSEPLPLGTKIECLLTKLAAASTARHRLCNPRIVMQKQ